MGKFNYYTLYDDRWFKFDEKITSKKLLNAVSDPINIYFINKLFEFF